MKTDSIQNQIPAPTGAASTLPEHWPESAASAPVRAAWIPWPIAPILAPLFWLMPRRLGPHLAAAGWRAAIFSHLLWVAYGVGSLLMLQGSYRGYTLVSWLAGHTPEQLGQTLLPEPTLTETLRAPLGLLAMAGSMTNASPLGVTRTDELLRALLVGLAAEAGLLLLAGSLMPCVAAGERTRRLLARTVRLVLWATTSLVALALALQVLYVSETICLQTAALAISLYVAWAVSLVVRGGSRYAGPPEGPGWEPARAECETCGYSLTGLRRDGTCPECGKAIAESLPERRRPTTFRAAASLIGRLRVFVPTVRAALRGDTFYRTMRTSGELPAAAQFAAWTAIAGGALVSLLAIIYAEDSLGLQGFFGESAGQQVVMAAAVGVAAGVLLFLATGLTALLASRLGRRSLLRYGPAVFYSSAWQLVILLSCVPSAGFILAATACEDTSLDRAVVALVAGAVALLVLPAWLAAKAVKHLRRAIRQTRYASA